MDRTQRAVTVMLGIAVLLAGGAAALVVRPGERLAVEPAPVAAAGDRVASPSSAGDAAGPAAMGPIPTPVGFPPPVPPRIGLVTVEPSGEARLVGEAEPGAMVEIFDNGRIAARALVSGGGEWGLALDAPLTPGTHDLALRVTAPDARVQLVADQRISVLVPPPGSAEVLVAMTEPGIPTQVLQLPGSVTPDDLAPTQPAAGPPVAGPPVAGPPVAGPPVAGLPVDAAASPSSSLGERVAAVASAPTPTVPPAAPEGPAPPSNAVALASPQPRASGVAGVPPSLEPAAGSADLPPQSPVAASDPLPPSLPTVESEPAELPRAEIAAVPPSGELREFAEPRGDGLQSLPSPAQAEAPPAVAPPAAVAPEPVPSFPAAPGATVAALPEPQRGATAAAPSPPAGPPAAEPPVIAPPTSAPPLPTAPELSVAALPEPPAAPNGFASPAPSSSFPAGEPAPVTVSTVEVQTGGRVFATGEAPPDAEVRLYVDDAFVAELDADGDGRWSFAGEIALAGGDHRLRVDEVADAGGQVTGRAEVSFAMPDQVAQLEPPAVPAELAPPAASGPTPPAPEAIAVTAPAADTVTIRRGDNLWTIARRVYGAGIRYTTIYAANRDQIRDPDLVYPGQVFVIPPPDPAWGLRPSP